MLTGPVMLIKVQFVTFKNVNSKWTYYYFNFYCLFADDMKWSDLLCTMGKSKQ
jgi:hypothetical protein